MPDPDPILSAATYFWLIAFGSCIGSFLNVLIYRLPRQKSLVYPASHCPHCGHLIRWYDNIPVFGWIKLRGKCRDCQLPINIRYPCIEGFCGILCGGIFALLDQLLNIPFWLLVTLTLFLSFLGINILAICLIIYDKKNNKTDF